jgi:hypothetical protein
MGHKKGRKPAAAAVASGEGRVKNNLTTMAFFAPRCSSGCTDDDDDDDDDDDSSCGCCGGGGSKDPPVRG